jgi:hypothetical protein
MSRSTGTDPQDRRDRPECCPSCCQCRNDPTFLLADVEVVAEYQLFNINRSKMEGLIHKALAAARLDLAAGDRFGRTVQPREWFLIPFQAIDDLISKISDGSVTQVRYDPMEARFVPAET